MLAEVQRVLNAPLERVWAAAGDFTVSPMSSMTFEIEQDGDAAQGGIGCIRKAKLGKSIYRERLDAIDPPKSYAYTMLSGGPFKSYGTVTFTAEGDSTRICWSTQLIAKYPGIGWIAKKITRHNYNMFIDGIEKRLQ
jgi:uncharacterized protein YndB with AHSA1/START domain